jgi:hypothetical protein
MLGHGPLRVVVEKSVGDYFVVARGSRTLRLWRRRWRFEADWQETGVSGIAPDGAILEYMDRDNAGAVNLDAGFSNLNPFEEVSASIAFRPCEMGHWFFRFSHKIHLPRLQVQGKMILLGVVGTLALL